MKIPANQFLEETLAWFEAHPEREFRLTEFPATYEYLAALSLAGWIAGQASAHAHPHEMSAVEVDPFSPMMPCVIRRPAPEDERPLPGVFVLDKSPPLPTAIAGPRAEEKFCETIWRFAQTANSLGLSLNDFLIAVFANTAPNPTA